MARYPGRTDGDEIWTCSGCGMQAMSRGADVTDWKGVQLGDDGPELTWFCGKDACKELRDEKIVERTKELRVRAGLPPNPKMKEKQAKPRVNRYSSGGGNVFAPPPGGFAASEVHEEEEEGERDGEGKRDASVRE
jgi:hypothetical protein